MQKEKQKQRTLRFEEAKTKNKTFQMFDKMLGIEKDPKLAKIREENPLNKIAIPHGEIGDLDQRVAQYYVPVYDAPDFVHPVLAATQDDQRPFKNGSQLNKSQLLDR